MGKYKTEYGLTMYIKDGKYDNVHKRWDKENENTPIEIQREKPCYQR